MRISVCNWQTSQQDVKRTLEGVKRAMRSMRSDGRPKLLKREFAPQLGPTTLA